MSNRPREPIIKATPRAAKFSWGIKKYRRKTKCSFAIRGTEALESLLFNRHKLRTPAGKDAGETMVTRLKRQLNTTTSSSRTSWRQIQERKTAETRVRRTKPGDKAELVELDEKTAQDHDC